MTCKRKASAPTTRGVLYAFQRSQHVLASRSGFRVASGPGSALTRAGKREGGWSATSMTVPGPIFGSRCKRTACSPNGGAWGEGCPPGTILQSQSAGRALVPMSDRAHEEPARGRPRRYGDPPEALKVAGASYARWSRCSAGIWDRSAARNSLTRHF